MCGRVGGEEQEIRDNYFVKKCNMKKDEGNFGATQLCIFMSMYVCACGFHVNKNDAKFHSKTSKDKCTYGTVCLHSI